MKIGLYFGSFNPIHIGHLIIANHILNETDLQKVWFIVSPQNPFKHSDSLLNEYDRLHLVQKAIEGDDRLKASEIEFSLPKPSYTVHTLTYLSEKYPTYQFSIIMGSDGFQNLGKWKNPEVIIRDYPIIIYERPGFKVDNTHGARVQIMNAPLLEISATHIRELIKAGKSIKYLVPPGVEEEILSFNFFKKPQKK
ncbi:nicotinate (nicotinamide) nucleotide adenylyltransferase [Flavisolibacter ginsengisoli]|jgi:nicotinate-nucleotide adenylyltransferase|uniref:Probable nicotinate-nucleotide adenylyltransferase n=1 Tax=Flavisolibacter ginsengisoli DSM 18119 TaxID=1121884 RepID=A0A1M5CHP1_9BACT|nr:nicotinate (nicotinamide) nucleotide adenylyltransferase [Flavisolibacter ginsengisoli]SHF54238.1 nicotinate-nucleotide adenylyltransferase [Flavisolibacter ginsengisoli DSM 18119]